MKLGLTVQSKLVLNSYIHISASEEPHTQFSSTVQLYQPKLGQEKSQWGVSLDCMICFKSISI